MNKNGEAIADLYPYLFRSIDDEPVRRVVLRDKTGWDEIFEPTYTSIEHSNRLIIEWSVNTLSFFGSFLLCFFLWWNKKLMVEYSHSITFVTFASHILYWPFYIFSTWQTINLLLEHVPYYPSILSCSLLRHMIISTFQSATLVTFPIAINQLYRIIRRKSMNFEILVALQIFVTFFELAFILGHISTGDITMNDICTRFISSITVFSTAMIINHSILLFTLIINIITLLVQKSSPHSWIILVQTVTQIILQTPLSYRQFYVLLAKICNNAQQHSFKNNYGYMIAFSCVFVVPFSSLILVRQFRTCSRIEK